MKLQNISKLLVKTLLSSSFPLLGLSQTVVWEEDFTGFASGTDYLAGVASYTFGFDGEDDPVFDPSPGAGNNVKPVTEAVWVKAGSLTTAFGFNDIGGGNIAAQPCATGVNASKGMGVFLSNSLFTPGSGTYTLSFDIIGDEGEQRNARAWIGTSSTHDMTVANGWGIDVSDVMLADGDVGTPWLLTGTATVTEFVSANLDTVNSDKIVMEFDYIQGEDVGIAIATANSDAAFDNFKIIEVVESNDWVSYTIDGNGNVDTGEWMGILHVAAKPWVWRYDVEEWIYMPEGNVSPEGAWTFIVK